MIWLLTLGPAKHEKEAICKANQRISNVYRIARAACCEAIRMTAVGEKYLLSPTSCEVGIKSIKTIYADCYVTNISNLCKRCNMDRDEKYMREAIKQAKKAEKIGEVPIGCVIVYQDKIIARGYNRRKTDKNTLSHAELNAIRRAGRVMGDWRLEDCDMYVTLEPCQMCAGAIVQARMRRVYIGCMSPKSGCAGSVLNLLQVEEFNHQVEIVSGVLLEECSKMLSDFFAALRIRVSAEKAAAKFSEEA